MPNTADRLTPAVTIFVACACGNGCGGRAVRRATRRSDVIADQSSSPPATVVAAVVVVGVVVVVRRRVVFCVGWRRSDGAWSRCPCCPRGGAGRWTAGAGRLGVRRATTPKEDVGLELDQRGGRLEFDLDVERIGVLVLEHGPAGVRGDADDGEHAAGRVEHDGAGPRRWRRTAGCRPAWRQRDGDHRRRSASLLGSDTDTDGGVLTRWTRTAGWLVDGDLGGGGGLARWSSAAPACSRARPRSRRPGRR